MNSDYKAVEERKSDNRKKSKTKHQMRNKTAEPEGVERIGS